MGELSRVKQESDMTDTKDVKNGRRTASAPVPGSALQVRILRDILNHPFGELQIAGHGNAGYLSAANALVRRGLAGSFKTGCFHETDEGREWVVNNPPNTEITSR